MICAACQTSNDASNYFCCECGAVLVDMRLFSNLREGQPVFVPPMDAGAQKGNVDALLGLVIDGRYRLDTRIGTGGMGAVYRGTRLLIGDTVALKVLHPEQAAGAQTIERFQREAQAAARLKHPNAVAIYDFGVSAEGWQYLVMELVEGQSLRQIIKGQGPLTPSAAAEIITQVCAALDEAHRQQIIHRDIKPDNLIVQTTLTELRVKVLDFGIAKLRDQTASNLTQTGSVMGTPRYMSPEQCLGEELDSRSDIYSLGVVLYEMLCGVVPFNSPISTAIVVQHVNQSPPPLHLINASISPLVEAVVMRALEKRREARPQTAGEFARELTAAVKGIPPSPQIGPTAGNKTPDNDPANDSRPTLVVTTPPSVPYLSAPQPVAPASDAAPRSTARVILLTVVATMLLLGLGGIGAWLLFREQTDEAVNTARANSNRGAATSSNSNSRSNSNNTNLSTANLNVAPSPSPTPTPTPNNTYAARAEIMSLLNLWSGSLSRRDMYDHLRLYAEHLDNFYQLYDVDKEKVRSNRQSTFTRYYTSANVQVSDVNIDIDPSGTTATVYYDTTYDWRGGTRYLTGKSHNEMVLSKLSGAWLITSEMHLQTYYEDKGN